MSGWNESVWFSFAVSAAFKSTVVLGAAWLLALALRKRSAAARHLAWTAAAVAVLALPLLTLALPALQTGGAGSVLDSGGLLFHATSAVASDAGTLPAHGASAAARPVAHGSSPRRADWQGWLLWLWAAGVAVAAGQLAVACGAMWRARRRSRPFADGELVSALCRSLAVGRHVDVLETGHCSMPMTFGLLRPTVFLPADAAGWPEERRRLVLLHELAHVRRGDAATHWLARAAVSLYWWNPLAWAAWRAFLRERERAADDLVLAAGARASAYASQLLEIARTLQSGPAAGWAAVAMARPSQLEGHLLAILDPGVRRGAPRKLAGLAAAALAVALVAPLAAVHAQTPTDPAVPADIDATILAANAQKNHEILDQAAMAAAAQGKLDLARKLLEAAAAIREQVSGRQSVDYGLGLVKLGELAERQGRMEEAKSYFTQALQAIGERPEAVPALLQMGVIALSERDPDRAFEYFQHAGNVDPAHAQKAWMWMAVVRSGQEGKAAEAEADYQKALALADADSLEKAGVLSLYAGLLGRTGRADEAAALTAQATEIRKAIGARAKAEAGTAPREGVYRVGNGVTVPAVVYKPEVEYSTEARVAKYSGAVTLTVEIGPDGVPRNIHVVGPLGLGLDEKAVEAVRQWRFKPGTKDGVPVTVFANIEVNFRLL
jgi:TonB family protein